MALSSCQAPSPLQANTGRRGTKAVASIAPKPSLRHKKKIVQIGTPSRRQSWAKKSQAKLLEAVDKPHGFLPHGIISDVHIFPASVVMSRAPSDITALKFIFLEAWRQPDVGTLESYLFELRRREGAARQAFATCSARYHGLLPPPQQE